MFVRKDKMRKFKLFVENFLVYGLGGIICKIIPLIMVPIVTRLMPDSSYYGISDLSNTVVSFASALAVIGMYDAMYRMFFEKEDEEYKRRVCSTAFVFTVITSFIVFAVMLLCKGLIAQFFLGDEQYAHLVYISAIATFVGATNSIVAAPTRMQNKKKLYLFGNIITSVLSYAISIPLLLNGHYIIALPLAGMVAALSKEMMFAILNRKWFIPRLFDLELLKQMLVIAIPLFPNFLIYWIFNSCDKIMITNMIGIGAAGIYSVGSKLGHASQLIYTAFSGGWQYFAFSTMKEDNQVKSNSLVFEYLGIISFVTGIFMAAWSYLIFKILFVGEYVDGYIVAPYLFLAPLLQMLFQVACNQFIVIKKTWPNMVILLSGAVINVIINFALIPVIGIEGAAIATLLGYAISDVICVLVLSKMKLFEITPRFILATLITTGYIVIWRLFFKQNIVIATLLAICVTVVIILLYKEDLRMLVNGIKCKGDKEIKNNDNAE